MVPQDLVVFRKAIDQLDVIEPSSDRRNQRRYTPVGPLSRAKVVFFDGRDPEDADVVDLSFNGLSLAVASCCRCSEGDRCTIQITPDGITQLQFDGEVRWVTIHPFITVFGVQLKTDDSSIQPV